MTAERPNAELIFHRALDIQGAAERAAYLEQACQGDPELSAEVEALIRFHERAGDFLNTPALASGMDLATNPVTEGPGTVIGHYKLLEKIGEGGMAVVYMAQQQEPIQRQVALKLIKLGMASDMVIARFEAERQALALMDHPNIAKVLDAGTTESGRPYFVMELVKGVSITRFCDNNTLSTQDRLNLFRSVCQAVHHAHQKGVIHRDIKPSNVMVTLHDGRAVPKVIDFGIAKAIHRRLTEKTLFTHYAQIIGTPLYMSPEQAEMSGLDVDTRTDVYSLGVLLYELLTGRAPFEAAYLRSKGYAEIQRIIREEEPTKPSTKISTLGQALIDIAELRGTSPDALRRLIRADLDWIVMKALEKERTRRYDSARELCVDIERHLNNEPVRAGPPSLWYSSQKFLRRHRTLALTAVAVTLALLLGFAVSRFQFERKAKLDREFAAVECLYAEGRYQAALNALEAIGLHRIKNIQVRLLYTQVLSNVGRIDEAQRELHELLDKKPAIAGAVHYRLARIYRGVDATKADAHGKLAESLAPHSAYGHTLRALAASTPNEALPWLDEAVRIDPGDYDARKARALVKYSRRDFANMRHDVEVLIGMRPQDSLGYGLRALALRGMGELEQALSDHDQAIDLCETNTELPVLLDQRQETLWRMGNHQAALQDAQRCVDLAPEVPGYAVALGKNLFKLGRYEEAKREFLRIKNKAWKQVVMVMMRDAFDSASEDELLDMPDSMREAWPFFWMFHYVDLYKSLARKARRLVRGTVDISSWSPDGRELAYTRSEFCGWDDSTLNKLGASGPVATQGIEILDLESGRTRVLTTFGGGPAWSPDGRHIAFVRAPDLTTKENAEIWLVAAAGGSPRRLVDGGNPGWTRHPSRLYYHSRTESSVCYIDIADANSRPVYVAPCPGLYPHVSPDERYLAYAMYGVLTVVELATGGVALEWMVPGAEPYCTVRWSPDGREISLSALGRMHHCSGLWVFDFERRQGRHLFDPETVYCNWSPDRSHVALDVFFPVSEIWLAQVDPNLPTAEALAPLQTRAEYLRSDWHKYVASASFDRLSSKGKQELLLNLRDVGASQHAWGEHADALWTLQQVEKAWKSEGFPPDSKTQTLSGMALKALERSQEVNVPRQE